MPTKKTTINLLRGWPSPHLLPAALLNAAATKALSNPETYIPGLQYGPDPGFQPLRDLLAQWLGTAYGAPEKPDRILISGGASQNLACVLQSFTDPGYTRAVWAVAPCYFLACPIFEDAGFAGRLKAVREDQEGVDVEWLAQRLREADATKAEGGRRLKDPGPMRKIYRHVIYAVPTCANPSGKTMSLRRRQALVELARKHDALVVCDDVYDLLQWSVGLSASSSPSSTTQEALPLFGPLLPRLTDIDLPHGPSAHDPPGRHFGHALSNGSFSKLIGPGIRTGWAVGTPDFVTGLSRTGSNRSGGAASQFGAMVVSELLRAGALAAHLDTVTRPALRRRHALMVRAVKRVLGPMGAIVRDTGETGKGARDVYGGYFLWLRLPAGVDAGELAARALSEEDLIVAPGRNFEVKGDEEAARFGAFLRLTFSYEEEEDLVDGVERLGSVLERMLYANRPEVVVAAEHVDTDEFK